MVFANSNSTGLSEFSAARHLVVTTQSAGKLHEMKQNSFLKRIQLAKKRSTLIILKFKAEIIKNNLKESRVLVKLFIWTHAYRQDSRFCDEETSQKTDVR